MRGLAFSLLFVLLSSASQSFQETRNGSETATATTVTMCPTTTQVVQPTSTKPLKIKDETTTRTSSAPARLPRFIPTTERNSRKRLVIASRDGNSISILKHKPNGGVEASVATVSSSRRSPAVAAKRKAALLARRLGQNKRQKNKIEKSLRKASVAVTSGKRRAAAAAAAAAGTSSAASASASSSKLKIPEYDYYTRRGAAAAAAAASSSRGSYRGYYKH